MAEWIGRYRVFEQIASGGTATVHLARMAGPHGFSRALAAKRLHPQLATDSELALMLLDEARLTSRIRSPFVVSTVDVVAQGQELLIVMEYVLGESLAGILRPAGSAVTRESRGVAPDVAAAIMVNVLSGLHAAHELKNDVGESIGLVHRDVSPQNILVGADGVARVLDFGIAKAMGRSQTTREGTIKGKLAYMSPEQMRGMEVDRRTDIFAASIVFWELLTGERLFGGTDEQSTIGKLLMAEIPAPSTVRPELGRTVDELVMKGLSRDPSERYETALAMASAIEQGMPVASTSRVATWLDELIHDDLARRRERLRVVEQLEDDDTTPPPMNAPMNALFGEQTGSAQSLSVDSWSQPRARLPARRRVVFSLAFAAVLAIGAGAFVVSTRPDAVASPVHSATAAPTTSVEAPGENGAEAAPTAKGAAPLPLAGEPSTAEPPAPPPAKVRTTKPAPAKPDCKNPYTFDEQGRKRYRRECLKP